MSIQSPLLRSMIDDGSMLFPHARSIATRKALIVLSSPYLFVRAMRRKRHGDSPCAGEPCKEILDYTEMFITSYCNLKCVYCSASIPYYYHKYHIDKAFLFRQIDAYLEAIDGVEVFRILGGEPFLHPDLADIVERLAKSDKVRSLRIVTNGAIVPKGERLLALLANEKIVLDISNYGEVSDKVPELERMEQAGALHLNIDTVTTWFHPNHVYDDQHLDPQAIADRYHACPDYCHVLRDGKFFSCGESFHIANIPDSPMRAGVDYVDVLDESLSVEEKRRQIVDVAFKRKPTMIACNHCGGGSFVYKDRCLVAGEQPKEGQQIDFDLPIDIPIVSTKRI